jgi:hypothetical protein
MIAVVQPWLTIAINSDGYRRWHFELEANEQSLDNMGVCSPGNECQRMVLLLMIDDLVLLC